MGEGDSVTDLFTHESTVSQSIGHIYRLQIIQQLELVKINWRLLYISQGSNKSRDKKFFLAHAKSLFYMLDKPWLRKNKESHAKMKVLLANDKFDDEKILEYFHVFLDEIEITKFDTKQNYDRTRVFVSNKHHEYM